MNRRLLLPLFLFLASSMAYSQNGNTVTIRFAGAPSGACGLFQYAVNNATGDFYDCLTGTWHIVSGAGGSGTVTSVSVTTANGVSGSVATATTTPAISLTLGAITPSSITIADTAANTDFSMSNTTAASVGTPQSSPINSMGGTYWTGAASAADTWTFQDVIGAGTNGTTLLTLNHSGSAGTAANPAVPTFKVTAAGAFANGTVAAQLASGDFLIGRATGQGQLVLGLDGAGALDYGISVSARLTLSGAHLALPSGNVYGWTSGTKTAALDTGLSRDSAGVIDVGTGANGSKAGSMNLTNLTATGAVSGATYLTATNCAAAGSAANPSVAACTAAPGGAFSCATNASTGTCQVTSTAITTSSNIWVQPTGATATGTRLSVTCNTTADTGLTAPRINAIASGSFTINLGTFATNPECFMWGVQD